MAQLLVRKVEDDVVRALKVRAAAHGISAEEEHRRILTDALGSKNHEIELNRAFADHLLSAPVLEEEDKWLFDRNDPRNKRPARRAPLDFEES